MIAAMGDLHDLSVLQDEPFTHDVFSLREKIDLLGQALGTLPARCREVVFLHKVEGVPQREIAARLGISVKTVEKQVEAVRGALPPPWH